MSPVKEADPAAKSLDDAFNDAMGAVARPREPAAPPDTDPDAPFGRDDQGEPIAPYGLSKDGKVKRSAGGRRPKDDTPRTATPAATAAAAATATPPGSATTITHDYSAALSEFADVVWFAGSALAKGGSALPFVGKRIPERKIGAQAAVFSQFKPTLVKAVNISAQHNAKAAQLCARVETGEITWVMMVGFLVMPFLTMSAAIWKGDKALASIDEDLSIEMLAGKNDKALDEYLGNMREQLEALTAAVAQAEVDQLVASLGDDPEAAAAIAQAREAGIL